MSKAIIFNLPAHGHINPSLAVIEELVARDEQVIYYTTDEFRAKIEATGATVRCYPLSNPQPPKSFSLLGLELGLFPQVLDEVQAEKPDYIGVPMVAIPQMPEQQMTAKRIAELNLGIALEKSEVTVNLLQSSVNRVMSEPQFAYCTGQMQQVVRQTGGYKQVADEILQFTH